jgi:hypothetical protein
MHICIHIVCICTYLYYLTLNVIYIYSYTYINIYIYSAHVQRVCITYIYIYVHTASIFLRQINEIKEILLAGWQKARRQTRTSHWANARPLDNFRLAMQARTIRAIRALVSFGFPQGDSNTACDHVWYIYIIYIWYIYMIWVTIDIIIQLTKVRYYQKLIGWFVFCKIGWLPS